MGWPKGAPSPNPWGRAAPSRTHRAYLRKLIGDKGEIAFDLLWSIARGELSFETLSREPGPNEDTISAALIPKVRIVPSIRERMDAAEILLAHLVGKPVSAVEVEAHVAHEHRIGSARDLSKLADADLAQLEALLSKATPARPAGASEAVVDAEIVEPVPEPEPKALPPAEPRRGLAALDAANVARLFERAAEGVS